MSDEIRNFIAMRNAPANIWGAMKRVFLAQNIGKTVAVSVRERGVTKEYAYPEPYNLTVEKVEGDKVYFSMPLDKIVGLDDEEY